MKLKTLKYFLSLKFFLAAKVFLFAQEDDFDFQKQVSDSEIEARNWNLNQTIQLDELNAYTVTFEKEIEKKYYIWLEQRVDDVYPFLEKAVREYYFVRDSAELIQNRRAKKKFIKERYNQLAERYEEQLKKLSTSRGQILARLMHRETGKTTYDIIKELRGGISAFLWNTAGGAFDIDLKRKFEPEKNREDLYIAVIIQKGLASGKYRPIEKEFRLDKRVNSIMKALGREE